VLIASRVRNLKEASLITWQLRVISPCGWVLSDEDHSIRSANLAANIIRAEMPVFSK
jgi:hypothetical protein